jgi:hypothetical protein
MPPAVLTSGDEVSFCDDACCLAICVVIVAVDMLNPYLLYIPAESKGATSVDKNFTQDTGDQRTSTTAE